MSSKIIVMAFIVVLAAPAGDPVDALQAQNVTHTNFVATPASNVLPVIQFDQMPITVAIVNLAREAGINCIIDPKLFLTTADGQAAVEPTVTFHLRNVTAKEALERMLTLRNIALVESPVSHVVRITRNGEPTNRVNVRLLEMETNNPVINTNDILPSIRFSDVPLEAGLDNLIRLSGMTIELDPRVKNHRDPLNRPTTISLRWEHITARQAIVALCENYDLVIAKDPLTGVIWIKPK